MFKLTDLNGNEVKFNLPLMLSSDGDLLIYQENNLEKIKREGKYMIQMLEFGQYIPY